MEHTVDVNEKYWSLAVLPAATVMARHYGCGPTRRSVIPLPVAARLAKVDLLLAQFTLQLPGADGSRMAADRWWSKDRSAKALILGSVGLLTALIIGVVAAVYMERSDHDSRMVHQPMEALNQVRVPGSVRHTSIISTGCGGYVSPIARRTDWSTLPPTEVKTQTAARVLAAGWTRAQEPDDGFELHGMSMSIAAEPTANGGSRVTTSIAAPDFCFSDQ